MCGRYSITVPTEALIERFEAVPSPQVPRSEPRYNAAPSQNLPVLLNNGTRQIEYLRWGLIPHWSKDTSTAYKMINARAETLTSKPSYREPLRKRRCLVLADGFYEWQKTGKTKTPMRMTLKSGEPFAFAGLWENWHDPESDLVVRTFTIITGKPNEVVAPIHDRMPIILLPKNEKIWLDNDAGEEAWENILQPYPADLMMAYPVSARVNATTNDDPSLIERAS
ncbi:MAG: SOS response-associated peptidase [Chloroflexota bacterium]